MGKVDKESVKGTKFMLCFIVLEYPGRKQIKQKKEYDEYSQKENKIFK